MNMKPAPTIFDSRKVINNNSEINNVTSAVSIPWISQWKSPQQEYQYYLSPRTQLKNLHV